MDFEAILHAASRNTVAKKEVKCLQTKFKPPSKEQREKDKALSEGVAKFLARKEQEEKKRRDEVARKREELAAMRALDPKANKRIQTMLKRTKSANKSVMEDAIDRENTAVTLSGPAQPDEDDYGFVSATSSALYDQIIKKMYSQPDSDKPKFSKSKKPISGNIISTKERVKQALLKQEEDDRLPHRRKKKEDGEKETAQEKSPEAVKSEKNRPKRPLAPPAMDFMELLKLAEKKQYEPIVFEKKPKESQEPEQLMTKKQKEEQEKLLALRRQKEERLKAAMNPPPKTSLPIKKERIEDKSQKKPVSAKKSVVESETDRLKRERDEALRLLKEKEELIEAKEAALRIQKEKEQLIRERDQALKKLQMLEEVESKQIEKKSPEKKPPVKQQTPVKQPLQKSPVKNSVMAPSNSGVNKAVVKKDQPFRKPITKAQLEMLRRKRKKKQDSDSEYDSELDDFIDDGPAGDLPEEDVSSVISQIFRYDRNKYSRNDDYDECMESNWAQISREEFYSTKCGLEEDLRDIQAEKRALAKKKMKSTKR